MATRPQSARAKRLKRARDLRHRMALVERALTSRQLHIEDVLGDPSATQGHMSIYRVLCATPSIGEETAKEICQTLGIWPNDHLSQFLTDQRYEIIAALPDRVKRKTKR